MSQARRTLGQRGEQTAREHLTSKGYALVTTNWRWAGGEIDLVMRDGETLVFAEVRSRTAASTEDAFASITPRKRAHMIRAAETYLSAHTLEDVAWRIDLVAIAFPAGQPPSIAHVQDALDW